MQKGRVRKYERENIFDTMKTDEKVSGHVLCVGCGVCAKLCPSGAIKVEGGEEA